MVHFHRNSEVINGKFKLGGINLHVTSVGLNDAFCVDIILTSFESSLAFMEELNLEALE